MKALYHRFDEALEAEPVPGRSQNAELTRAAWAWFDDRLVQDDVIEAVSDVLPDASQEQVLAVLSAVSMGVKQP